MIEITNSGVYDGISNDDYHADPCPTPSLSSSGLRVLTSKNPKQYKYLQEYPEDPTPALVIGNAIHDRLLLTPEKWSDQYAIKPEKYDGRKKEFKHLAGEWDEQGKTILSFKEARAILFMLEAVNNHPIARNIFTNGKPEQSLFWKDKEYGFWCRVKLDYMYDTPLIFPDYKSTISVHPDDLAKSMFNFGYHQQMAWYREGIKALGICENPAFLLVFQEKTPPYEIVVTQPDHAALEWGLIQNDKGRALFAQCLETGNWPGYAADVLPLALPYWVENKYQRDLEKDQTE